MKTFKEFMNETANHPVYHDMNVESAIEHLRQHPATGKHMSDSAQYDDERTLGKGIPRKAFGKAMGVTDHKHIGDVIDHINNNTDQYEGHIHDDGHHVTMCGGS